MSTKLVIANVPTKYNHRKVTGRGGERREVIVRWSAKEIERVKRVCEREKERVGRIICGILSKKLFLTSRSFLSTPKNVICAKKIEPPVKCF